LRVRTDTLYTTPIHAHGRASTGFRLRLGSSRGSLGFDACPLLFRSRFTHDPKGFVESHVEIEPDPLGPHEPFDESRWLIDYLRTKP
jgi:hypothetical protein